MPYHVEKLSTIDLGRQGENLARTVEIDVRPLLAQWPDATISLLCKRKHDTAPYVAVTEVRDGILTWPITSVETESAGDGKIELRAICGEVIAKSMTAVVRVVASLTGSETQPPEAAQGWVDQVLAAGSEAEESARIALEAADRAENAASDLDDAVADTTASARAAGERADLAGEHASAASLSATEAGEDAQRAEQAATAAEESAVSARESVSEAELARQGAEASAQAAQDEYNKAADKATVAQVSAAAAEQAVSAAAESKTAAEQSANAAKTSETNAGHSAEAAARSAADASAGKDAAAGSATAAKTAEENAAQSAEHASSFAETAEACSEDAENAMHAAAESARAASTSEENAAASAAKSEAAAQAAQSIIDDESVGTEKTWSSQGILDKLTVPFETHGNPVTCYPVEDSPLSIMADIQPKQHFDWVHVQGETTQITTTGRNLLKFRNESFSTTQNGVFVSYDKDTDEIVVRGTNTGNSAYLPFFGVPAAIPQFYPGDTYTLSANLQNGSTDVYVLMTYLGKDGVIKTLAYLSGGQSVTFAVPEDFDDIRNCGIGVNASASVLNILLRIQLELGASAGNWESYTGGKPSPSPAYPQALVDSIPAGNYYVPSTAPEGGYWRIDLNESLGGLGGYKDAVEVDAYTGRYRIVKKAAEYVVTGDERNYNVNTSGTTGITYAQCVIDADKPWSTASIVNAKATQKCTHFPIGNPFSEDVTEAAWIFRQEMYDYTNFRFVSHTALEPNADVYARKAYLAEEHAAGHPVTIRYALDEPVITAGQATRVSSISGLTALRVTSMDLTAPDPEHPCEITVLDTLKLRHCSKNLLDKARPYYASYSRGIPFIVNEADVLLPYNATSRVAGIAYVVPCVANQTYYLSCLERIPYQRIGIGEYGSFQQAKRAGTEVGGIGGFSEIPRNIVYKAKGNGVLVCFIGSQYDNSTDTNIAVVTGNEKLQLELWNGDTRTIVGDDSTTFEPYCGEDVRAELSQGFQGGAVDLTSGKEKQTWERLVLDGTEYWSIGGKYFPDGSDYYYLKNGKITNVPDAAVVDMMCTHYPDKAISNNTITQGVNIVWQILRIRWGTELSLSDWRAYLAAEYDAGHPVTIYYRVQIPTMQSSTAIPIRALRGCNLIMSDANELSITGHADPVHIIGDLTTRLAALEETTATQN